MRTMAGSRFSGSPASRFRSWSGALLLGVTSAALAQSSPPTARATETNLSAQSRSGAERTKNYYGDRWRLTNTSDPGNPPVFNVRWDFNFTGEFSEDEEGAPTEEDVVEGYFPCEAGSESPGFRVGTGCLEGFDPPPSSVATYQYALQVDAELGSDVFVSPEITVFPPQANIVGFEKGVLRVLAGGNADASQSQGNVAEAQFDWTFFPLEGTTLTLAQGQIVPVPSDARDFTLDITYKDGFVATARGSVVQISLVPAFSLSPDPVAANGIVTLTNQMQVGTGTQLVGTAVAILPVGTLPQAADFASLPASFSTAGGTAAVTAPGNEGSFIVHVRYDFFPPGSDILTSVTATQNLTVCARPLRPEEISADKQVVAPGEGYRLSWSAVAGASSYKVIRFRDSSPLPTLTTTSTFLDLSTTQSDSGHKLNQAVRAVGACGTEGAYSSLVTVSVVCTPAESPQITSGGSVVAGQPYSLTWIGTLDLWPLPDLRDQESGSASRKSGNCPI